MYNRLESIEWYYRHELFDIVHKMIIVELLAKK